MMHDRARRIDEVEDVIKRREERISELRDEINELRELIGRMRKALEGNERCGCEEARHPLVLDQMHGCPRTRAVAIAPYNT